MEKVSKELVGKVVSDKNNKTITVLVETYRASLVIADSDMNNYFLVVCEEHENIKLGLDLSRDHFLKKPQIDDTIHVLKNYKKLCEVTGW